MNSQPAITVTPSNVNLNSNIMRNADIDTSNKVRLLSVNTLNTHNLQTMHNLIHSSGLLTGCVCTVNGSAIDMTAGTLLFHQSNTFDSNTYFCDVQQMLNQSNGMTDLAINYAYLQFIDSTTPPTTISFSINPPNDYTQILLCSFYKSGSTLYLNSKQQFRISDHPLLMTKSMQQSMGIMNAMGGLLAEIGSRQLTLTAATFWFGLNKIDISSKNTSVSDVFNLVWSAGNTPNQTTVPNAQFDNNGTLTTAGGGKFLIFWIYLSTENTLLVQYGNNQYASQAAAIAGTMPILQNQWDVNHFNIGYCILVKSATNFSVIANTYGNMNNVASTAVKAKDVTYNNTGSNLTSVDVQSALTELAVKREFLQFNSTALPAINNKITAWNIQASQLSNSLAYSNGDVTVQPGIYKIAVRGSFAPNGGTNCALQVGICTSTISFLSNVVSQQTLTILGSNYSSANNLIEQFPIFIYKTASVQVISLFLLVNDGSLVNPEISWFISQF